MGLGEKDVGSQTQLPDGWFTPFRFGLLLFGFLFTVYPEVILGSHTFFFRDFGHFGFPVAHYHRESFWNGEIPLWNPYSTCGIPFLAQWNTLVLYPGSLIYLLLPEPWGVGWFCLAHVLLAGLGMYRLTHELTGSRFAACVGGLLFAFNGFTLHAVMWPNNIAAWGWLPWVLWSVRGAWRDGGKALVPAVLLGGLQMLCGAPEIILFTWLLMGVWLLAEVWQGRGKRVHNSGPAEPEAGAPGAWSAIRRFVLVGVMVAALCAAQLLPFLELVIHSHREAGFDTDMYALPAWGWANLLVPLFRATPSATGVYSHVEQQWTSSFYPGITGLALAIWVIARGQDRVMRWLAAFGLMGLILALGQKAFLLPLFQQVLPLFDLIRFPVKYVVPMLIVTPILAAAAIAHWERFSTDDSQREGVVAGRIWLLLLLATGFICYEAWCQPGSDEDGTMTVVNGVSRMAWLILLGVLLLLGHRHDLRRIKAQAVIPSNKQDEKGKWQPGKGFAQSLHGNSDQDTPRHAGSPVVTGAFLRGAVLLVIGLDILTHTPEQNPTVVTQAYEPGVARLNAMPRLGEGRAMVSPRMELFLSQAVNPDALNYCISMRRALFTDWNLLEGIPKVNGFFSMYPAEHQAIWRRLYESGAVPPAPLMNFLGVSRISNEETVSTFNWDSRSDALPLIIGGQKPLFVEDKLIPELMTSEEFDPEQVVLLPAELESANLGKESAEIRIEAQSWSTHRITFDVDAADAGWVVIAQGWYPHWRAFIDGDSVPLFRANHAFQAIQVPAGQHAVVLEYRDRTFLVSGLISIATLFVLFAMHRIIRRQ